MDSIETCPHCGAPSEVQKLAQRRWRVVCSHSTHKALHSCPAGHTMFTRRDAIRVWNELPRPTAGYVEASAEGDAFPRTTLGEAAPGGLLFEGLTPAQQAIVQEAWYCRAEVADYLRRGVAVCVVPNREVDEAPPFALAVVENPEFWLGCYASEQEATECAVNLGLRVPVV